MAPLLQPSGEIANDPRWRLLHKRNEIVRISTSELGVLEDRVRYCGEIAPRTFGTSALKRNHAARGLL